MNASRNHPINCGLATTSSFGLNYSKKSYAFVELFKIEQVNNAPSQAGEVVVDDRVTQSFSSASGVYNVQVDVKFPSESGPRSYEIFVDNPSVFAVAPNLSLLSHVADGQTMVTVTTSQGESIRFTATAESFTSQTTNIFDRWLDGTAAKALDDSVVQNVTGEFENIVYGSSFLNGRLNMFVPPGPYAASGWTRNPNFWLGHIDWSSISIRNSRAHNRCGTLISPRYAICTSHFPLSVGDQIYFVASDNTPIARTVESVTMWPWPLYDAQLLRLSAPIVYADHGVNFAKVMPTNWGEYIRGVKATSLVQYLSTRGIAGVEINQDKLASVAPVRFGGNGFSSNVGDFPTTPSPIPNLSIRVGDSGHPCFLLFNQEPVLVGTWSSMGSGLNFLGDPNFSGLVNAVMAADNEALTPIDLSAFTNFAS